MGKKLNFAESSIKDVLKCTNDTAIAIYKKWDRYCQMLWLEADDKEIRDNAIMVARLEGIQIK